MAAIASTTGTTRGQIQGSCRPCTSIFVFFWSLSTVSCDFKIEEGGLIATVNSMGSPVEIPPKIPPAKFSFVWMVFLFDSKLSLCSLPRKVVASNPCPNAMPLVVPIDKMPWAKRASNLSKTGSPKPGGQPIIRVSMVPPI